MLSHSLILIKVIEWDRYKFKWGIVYIYIEKKYNIYIFLSRRILTKLFVVRLRYKIPIVNHYILDVCQY